MQGRSLTAGDADKNQAVRRFIESFSSALVEAGVPQMPALVFVALLATDDDGLTGDEIAARLQVSRAAISGAVNYLSPLGLITRERQPGSRRYRYVLRDPTWFELVVRRERMLDRWDHGHAGRDRRARTDNARRPQTGRIARLLRVPPARDPGNARALARAASGQHAGWLRP